MTWSWTVATIAPASTHPADDITRLTDALFLLRSNFYGGTAPSGTSIDTCMWWADSTSGLMKVANTGASAFISGWRLSDLSRPDDQVIWSNAADPTKKVKVDLSGVAAGATRTAKMPDKNLTLAGLDDVQGGGTTYAASTNSGNAYSVSLTPAVTALSNGQRVRFKASAANTGDVTLAVDALSAIHIYKSVSSPLAAGDIANGGIVEVVFDGTNFQLVSVLPVSAASWKKVVLTSGTSWPIPSTANRLRLTLQAAGQSGGAGSVGGPPASGGAGGQCGATVIQEVDVTGGGSLTYAIGAAGAVNLGVGGDTTVTIGGNTITAKGGATAIAASSTAVPGGGAGYTLATTASVWNGTPFSVMWYAGGAPGAATAAGANPGNPGSSNGGYAASTGGAAAGTRAGGSGGAGTPFGAGGNGSAGSAGTAANGGTPVATAYGAGGGGSGGSATGAPTGGLGIQGCLVIEGVW